MVHYKNGPFFLNYIQIESNSENICREKKRNETMRTVSRGNDINS